MAFLVVLYKSHVANVERNKEGIVPSVAEPTTTHTASPDHLENMVVWGARSHQRRKMRTRTPPLSKFPRAKPTTGIPSKVLLFFFFKFKHLVFIILFIPLSNQKKQYC